MVGTVWRWPAEWEPQDAVLIAWPHAGTDWAARLAEVERSTVALAAAISQYQHLIVCVADADVQRRAQYALQPTADLARVRFTQVAYHDTWLRDSGPITLIGDDGRRLLTDFRFTGWGGKFDATVDDALVAALFDADLFAAHSERKRIDWPLEGGAVESDGRGNILSTWKCLGSRHPNQSRDAIAHRLCDALSTQRVLWLDHGELQGDDTDAHIDTLARFAPNDAIIFQACDDAGDPHHAALTAMADELATLRNRGGMPYCLHPLPWPQPIMDVDGRRLAASYANYLVINEAVLVPAYGVAADGAAATIIGAAHPGRDVISIPARPWIWQNGSLHCLTMQIPAGTLRTPEMQGG